MRRSRIVLSGYWTAILAIAVAPVAGCGDDCHVGDSECISTELIQTCVPTENGHEWLVHQCGANEKCADRALESSDAGARDGGEKTSSAATKGHGAACVGRCDVGDHSCVSPTLSQVCVSGGIWEPSPCPVGQSCDDATGECAFGGDAAVKACKPGAKACASDKVAKICDADGSGWVEQPCAANEACVKDACTADPKSSCDDDANSCIDNKTALRCIGGDKGFEVVQCKGDTYCEAGRCRGSVCALGSMCLMDNQLRECVDGKSYKDSQCGVNEVCQQVKDVGKCVPKACTVGASQCGDPRDPMVDPKKFYSQCMVASGGSGVPEWVRGECTGNSTCDPTRYGMPWLCSQTCTKGAQRCASDPTGVNDGFQTCGDDGKWGPLESCNTDNMSQKQCVLEPNPNASVLPKAACAEPVCAWAFSNPTALAQGVCDGDQLRKCKQDGSLAEPTDCAQGICRNVNAVITPDGRTPATCDSMPQCQEAEELCLNAGTDATPRYRTCVNGYWSTEIKTCENDGACINSHDAKGKRKKVCGGECTPKSHRCNSDGELETCDDGGKWGRGEQCALGTCKTTGSNDSSCVAECVPGSVSCTGATSTAADGFHEGRAQQRMCQSDGTWSPAMACGDGKLCRTSGSGASVGCVSCIGPNVPGGNAEASVDSRCDPNEASKIQDCGENNTWLSSRTCSDGKSCVPPTAAGCGMCMGVATMFQCTETNLMQEQYCGSCMVAVMGGGTVSVATCTETAIAATANVMSPTCSGSGAGTPGAWGGQTDCCSTAQKTSGATCASRGFGAPMDWAGVTGCCGTYRQGTTGASFAYCD